MPRMTKTWIEPEEISPPPTLIEVVGGHPLVAETLARRGITDPGEAGAFLDPALYTPSPAAELPGLSRCADRIEKAIHDQETILVWGDFDVDGQTSTTLLVEALHNLGASVVYHIPNRAAEGHGIRVQTLADLLSPSPPFPNPYPPVEPAYVSPALLLTCDTGISEHEGLAYAQSQEMDVVITDHHELPECLPEVYATVNPHLLQNGHPLGSLPGVGVAYKLVEELYNRRGDTAGTNQYLDLVALGIVADVAEQTGDTRYLLQQGLKQLHNTHRLGLRALYESAQINPERLDEGQIGFGIGPRLNALGRLSDANSIVEFFTTDNPGTAQTHALRLEGLNQERRMLTDQVYGGALAQIERDPTLLDFSALVLAHPGWPNGVIGIVASRLVDKYGLPTILFNIQEDGSAHGSARSIPGVHITEAITAQSDLLTRFGGHAGAAGMSLPAEHLSEFRTRLSRTIRGLPAEIDLTPRLQIDAFLPLGVLSLDLVDDLERLAPFGAGNPSLNLATREVKLVSLRKIGRGLEHLRLVVEDRAGNHQDVLWWRADGELQPEVGTTFDLAYKAESNTFRGERRLQLIWVDFRSSQTFIEDVEKDKTAFEVIDFRSKPNPGHLANTIRAEDGVQFWAEGEAHTQLNGSHRHQLTPGKSLVVWSAPPNQVVFLDVIKMVKPEILYLFAVSPTMDSPKPFLERLSGLVKNVINNRKGSIHIDELAAAMAHSTRCVRVGLAWLTAGGNIKVDEVEDERGWVLHLAQGDGFEKGGLTEITAALKGLLDEASAYRKYFTTASVDSLIQGIERE
jgi:single-stranded-DNA-specific exonuclease